MDEHNGLLLLSPLVIDHDWYMVHSSKELFGRD